MKKLFLLLLVCWSCQTILAQPYGNEWIDYSKTYYKLKVAQNGFYRLPYNTLSAAGLSGLAGSSNFGTCSILAFLRFNLSFF